jgi:gamma-glutamyltranspeptidase/glutathione hydrolase
MKRPLLARTLESIAQKGPDAFYTGELAQKMVAAAKEHGGNLSIADLKAYRSKEREALAVKYEGKTVYTMPPPSAGGLMMVQTLKMFPAEYLRSLGHGTPAYQHVLAEAMRGAVADRMRYLGDPDHQKVDLEYLLNDARLEKRRQSIVLDRTHSIPRFGLEEKGTHALIVADRSGHVISMTTTVNHLFGAKIFVEGTGIILNNELDDFTAKSSVLPFGMKETPNRPRAGARPVSSMTPTIVVEEGAAVLALGGSGGTAIATNATQTLLAALVFGHDPLRAVSADRIYIPTNGQHMLVEKGTKASHVSSLNRRGEIVGEMPFTTTAIQMLSFEGGKVRGAADPRKYGLAVTR